MSEKLTRAEERFMLDLQGYGPDWVGRKHVIANRMIERGLVHGDLERGRQMRMDLTRAGRHALLSRPHPQEDKP